jgi:metal-sulfur cluster biosynthetic enzyme
MDDQKHQLVKLVTRNEIIEALKTIEDPELFLDIWFLGLIYNIAIDDESGEVVIDMTFTSPMCPAGPQLKNEVETKVSQLPGVSKVSVVITFNPPWQASDEVKGLLGMM